jgi:hypothetical protein
MLKKIKTGVFLLFTLSIFLIFSCTDHEKEDVAIQQAEQARAERDTAENKLVNTMDEINQNLDRIREKQGLISMLNPENLSKKEEILTNIRLINDLIEDNKRKIEELTSQSRKLGKEKSALVRIADQTRARIAKQEEEIASLKEQLAKESFKVADLNKRMDEMQVSNEDLQAERTLLAESNAELDRNLYKGYFTYGTYKQLNDRNIVEKKGGILGIGKKEALANAYFKNKASFTELDIRETTAIPIHGKKPRLVTMHPTGSYEWSESKDAEYSTLKIINSEDFWSTSKFLVVEVR